ncbi:YheT family hydrolase [Zobellia galactanivorans]|uniref:Alpha/beta hydrolase-fold protein n=1 Tax=Zobellia galactanivorans (strain DSM 12802 / CCUG 47099 / CIP 106680 / NCIMB 13871 / Dsij) TaxID=63186 RepID=G0LAS3_ZOBGA|nr:alpha/beta fold hydrolase [Zobellia galactanivorans]CAZ95518.1 Alpha/beta hydrolase-fold protein [Zobellia galactanivorans]
MPLVTSHYNPPFIFKNGHLSTVYSGLFRRIKGVQQTRERIELDDGDFMDLDWSYAKIASEKVVILLHGLEGNAQRPYITGSAKAFNADGIDACAVNFRGCSGETNRLFRSYHSGATEDLDAVVQHIVKNKNYSEIYIKGVSLGGNMALKYAGEARDLPPELKAVIGVSVPCDLYSSLRALLSPNNYLYAKRFKKHLVEKLYPKQKMFPNNISMEDITNIKTLKDFDDIYTSRAHGFKNAIDYYQQCSCRQFLPDIKIPTLIINAKNDSFLGEECYPVAEANKNRHLYLNLPDYGGHVGFVSSSNFYYSEKTAIKFVQDMV